MRLKENRKSKEGHRSLPEQLVPKLIKKRSKKSETPTQEESDMLKLGIDFLKNSITAKKLTPAAKCSKVKIAKRTKKKFDEKMLVKPKEPKRPFVFFLLEYLNQVK